MKLALPETSKTGFVASRPIWTWGPDFQCLGFQGYTDDNAILSMSISHERCFLYMTLHLTPNARARVGGGGGGGGWGG